MLTSLVLSLAVAAPVPAATPPAPTGPAPRILELKPNADGKLVVTVLRTEMQEVNVTVVGPNNVPVTETRKVASTRYVVAELNTVKQLTVTTADGKKVDAEEALKKLEKGGTVVVSADGKPVSPAFLKLFKDDVLVLASPELTGPAGGAMPPQVRPGVRPLPIQIQPAIAPAVLPAAPAPAPVPVAPVKN